MRINIQSHWSAINRFATLGDQRIAIYPAEWAMNIHIRARIHPVAIRERSIIDHRGQKSRDETRADDESVPRMCTVAVLRLPVTNDLDELRENHELEPTTFSKPRAKLYIFRSSGRRIIHPRASFLFRTVEVEDRWWKTTCNCESFDAGRWCQCQDRLNRETAVVKNRVGHFFFGTKMVHKKVKQLYEMK